MESVEHSPVSLVIVFRRVVVGVVMCWGVRGEFPLRYLSSIDVGFLSDE